jgi:serine/threonine protein kinase
MLTGQGRVVIIDFGLCADLQEGSLTRMVGSPFFVAPEMVKREPYAFEVDVWSLGISLLQLCNNRLPYDQDPVKTMFMYAVVGVQKPFDEPKKWSLPLQDLIINGMLPLVPKERATAEEMLLHPIFKKAPWRRPKEQEVLQRDLASIWPCAEGISSLPPTAHVQGEVGEELEIDTGVSAAPTGSSTGILLDEDLPEFLPQALPSVNMDEVD